MTAQTTAPLLTAIIVDDELYALENLKTIIEDYCPEIKILGLSESAIQAKLLVHSLKPDVVFLDINMPVLDGFDFTNFTYVSKRFTHLTIFAGHPSPVYQPH